MKRLRVILIIVAVVCFGIALSYPIRYRLAENSNNSNMEQLAALREKNRAQIEEETPPPAETAGPGEEGTADGSPETDAQVPASGEGDLGSQDRIVPGTQEEGETLSGQPDTEKGPQAGAETEQAPSGMEQAPSETEKAGTPQSGPDATVAAGDAGVTGQDEGETPRGSSAAIPEPDAASPEPAATPGGESEPEEAPARIPEQTGETAVTPGGESEPEEAPARVPEETGATVTPGGDSEPEEAPARIPEQTDQAAGTPGGEEGVAASAQPEATDASPTREPGPTPVPTPTPTPGIMDLILGFPPTPTPTPRITPTPLDTGPTPQPSPTPNRRVYTGPLPYPLKEKVELDPDAILPELKEIYELNHDLVGWITIPDSVIDYPVVQRADSDFYLDHDFYGEENINGQIILDTRCDPYTPSYNLVISGHHMKNGSMFGDLPQYARKGYWEKHKVLEFDTLMSRKQYVVFASFYSADYDEDEEGFRYNVDIQYDIDVDQWMEQIRENQNYDTGIDVEFGDEFITLTTCNRARHRNGRFVVVCRKIREGETFE